jgi:hypothetical protein
MLSLKKSYSLVFTGGINDFLVIPVGRHANDRVNQRSLGLSVWAEVEGIPYFEAFPQSILGF